MRPALVAAAVLLATCTQATAAEHTKDSAEVVRNRLDRKEAILLDVRELREWNEGHLADAQLLPLSELKRLDQDPAVQQKLAKNLSKQKIIYCHCRSGGRVLTAADILGKLGYDVRPLALGFDDLREAGFPPATSK